MQFNQLDWFVITTYALACLQSTQVSLRLSIQKNYRLGTAEHKLMLWSIPTIHIRWLNPRHTQAMLWMNCCEYMYVRYLKYFSCHIMGFYSYISNLGYLLFCCRKHFSSFDDERCNNLFIKFNSCKLQQLQRLSKWCQISMRSLRKSICYIMPYNMHVISVIRLAHFDLVSMPRCITFTELYWNQFFFKKPGNVF